MSLKNKVVVVTGGSGGIGKAIIQRMTEAGAWVYFTYAKDEAGKKRIEERYAKVANQISGYHVDVRNCQEAKDFIDKIIKRHGVIDVLINNAGIRKDKPLAFLSESDWGEVIQTNLTGIYHMTKPAVIKMVQKKGGRIINISSVSGLNGMKGQTNYSASKAGLIGFTKSLAKELAGYGITVNAIAPGAVETNMLDGLSEKYLEKLVHETPIGRVCRPDEVAMMAICMADCEVTPDFLTGQVIALDGGMGL